MSVYSYEKNMKLIYYNMKKYLHMKTHIPYLNWKKIKFFVGIESPDVEAVIEINKLHRPSVQIKQIKHHELFNRRLMTKQTLPVGWSFTRRVYQWERDTHTHLDGIWASSVPR